MECFFSVLRDTVGKDFTLKEVLSLFLSITVSDFNIVGPVYYGWRKVTEEFVKRMDPDLPFYYHTSKHSRFYEGLMPDFSIKPAKRPKPLPRFELLGTNDRISFSVRGESSVRAKFHNVPINLPPPPSTHNPCTHEHSYATITQTNKK